MVGGSLRGGGCGFSASHCVGPDLCFLDCWFAAAVSRDLGVFWKFVLVRGLLCFHFWWSVVKFSVRGSEGC